MKRAGLPFSQFSVYLHVPNNPLRGFLIVFVLISSCTWLALSQGSPLVREVVISHVNVIPMDSERVLKDQTVVIENGRIAKITSGDGPVSKSVLRIDGHGKYLMPGLADLHVHLFSSDDLLAYVLYGVTTVLNMDGGPQHLMWRAQVREGKLLGPSIYTAGHTIDGFPPLNEMFLTAETPDQARALVREQKRQGYDVVKLYGTLRPDAFRAILDEATAQKIRVVGHVNRQVGALEVLKSTQVLAAHLEDLVAARFDHPPTDAELVEFADAIASSHITVTPNLNVNPTNIAQLQNLDSVLASPAAKLLSPAAYSQWMPTNNRNERNDQTGQQIEFANAMQGIIAKLTRLLNDRSVRLVLGTDAAPYGFPGLSAHQELQELVNTGVSPYQALVTATKAPGVFIGENISGAERFGTVSEGSTADLLLLSSNPLESIKNLDSIEGVILRGRWLPATELKQRAQSMESRFVSAKKATDTIDAALEAGNEAPLAKAAESHATEGSAPMAEWVLMAKARKLQGKNLKASIRIAELNTQLYPESFSAPYILADLLYKDGDVAGAKRQVTRSLALEPHNAASLNLDEKMTAVNQPLTFRPAGTYRIEYVNDQSHEVQKTELSIERAGNGQYGGKRIDGSGAASTLQSVVAGGQRIWAVADSPYGPLEFRITVKGTELTGYWAGPFGQNGSLKGTKAE